MIDWRAAVGTSIANGVLATMLASMSIPLSVTCYDCGGSWPSYDPESPDVFVLPLHVSVSPVEAKPEPRVRLPALARFDVQGPCPGHEPVDRLPALILTDAYKRIDLKATSVCVRVDGAGRVDRVRFIGRPSNEATALRRQLATLTFVPAVRDGAFVASWVLMRSEAQISPA